MGAVPVGVERVRGPCEEGLRRGRGVWSGRLDRMLTRARAVAPWLAKGASVPQQQIIRDFAASRTKALKDIKNRLR
ncbi:hypothetical protein GCM10023238_15120 [Streptomyces heliomycini]